MMSTPREDPPETTVVVEPQIPPRRRSLPGWVNRLAGLSEAPKRTAAAFALGVFLSFSPFFGLQVAIGLGIAVLLRLNRLAVFIGLCTNLPWLMVPWYALTTAGGSALLGVSIASDFSARLRAVLALSFYSLEFWRRLMDLLGPLFGAFVLGSTIGAAVVGVAAYFATARIIARIKASQR